MRTYVLSAQQQEELSSDWLVSICSVEHDRAVFVIAPRDVCAARTLTHPSVIPLMFMQEMIRNCLFIISEHPRKVRVKNSDDLMESIYIIPRRIILPCLVVGASAHLHISQP